MINGMRNIKEIVHDGDCSGCTACCAICSFGAIHMAADSKGFYKPHINEKLCIHCNQCIRVCPQNNAGSGINGTAAIYACRAKDENIQMESASGGFFYILACKVLDAGGIAYGAAFDESFTVQHTAAENVSELQSLRGSKYVQSRMGDSFKSIDQQLKSGRRVIFSGTPCQVSGLLSYLGGSRENLVTVDVICHGTPSPKIWQEYLRAKFREDNIKDIKFRYKKCGDKKDYFPLLFQTEKRTFLQKYEKNEFIKGFIANFYLNDSCYQCRYKGVDRVSDITLGDFWGIDSIQPGFSNGLGTSLLFIHTDKGIDAFDSVKDNLEYVEIPGEKIEQIVANNQSIAFSSQRNDQYNAFWKSKQGFLRTVNRLTRKPASHYLLMVKYEAKYAVYRILKSFLKRGKSLMKRAKKLLVNMYNSLYDIFLDVDLFFRWRKDLRLQKKLGLPKIMSIKKSLDLIFEKSLSVCRYGDGEFKIMDGDKIFFQQQNDSLSQRLKEVIRSNDSKVLVCMPDYLDRRHSIFPVYNADPAEREYARFARRYLDNILAQRRERWYTYFDINKKYGNTQITRCYVSESDSDAEVYFQLWKKIFADRSVLIVEGEMTRFGVGNDLLSGCKSVRRVLCPSKGAYSVYEEILKTVIELHKDNELCLIALGPTATVLAYDLTQEGIQALDIGHLDIEYEWMLRGDRTHKKIEGKFVSEAKGGDLVGEIEDKIYREQILCHVFEQTQVSSE